MAERSKLVFVMDVSLCESNSVFKAIWIYSKIKEVGLPLRLGRYPKLKVADFLAFSSEQVHCCHPRSTVASLMTLRLATARRCLQHVASRGPPATAKPFIYSIAIV